MKFNPIVGFENRYAVSDSGIIKSVKRVVNSGNGARRVIEPCVIKQSNSKGYKKITFRSGGKVVNLSVHRVVAQSFIPNPMNLPEVNHKDGDKHNNHVDNLEWCSASQNQLHAWESGLKKNVREAVSKNGKVNGAKNGIKSRRILSDVQVLEIRNRYDKGESPTKIAFDYSISRVTAMRVGKRERYKEIQ